jgi:hypothetical protein
MGYGLFDNLTRVHLEDEGIGHGLWLESSDESGLFDSADARTLWIIPNETTGIAEIEGPDHVQYADGPHKGRYVIDVLNEISRRHEDTPDPRNWNEDWEAVGFLVVDGCLKRFNVIDGYYHA